MNKQDIPAPAMANGWRSSFATSSWRKPLLSLAALAALLPAAAVQAAVVPLQLTLPSDIGLDMDFQVEIDWTTQPAASGGSLVLVLPPALSADPLALSTVGCGLSGNTVTCVIPPGTRDGTLSLPLHGQAVGIFNLTASGDDPGNTTATNTASIVTSGDLSVSKTKTAPAGDAIAGGQVSFELAPHIAPGGSNVPAGARLVVVDRLPGSVGQFNSVSASISGGVAGTCAVDVPGHLVRCEFNGPFDVASFNATRIAISGTQGLNGQFTNNVEIFSANASYLDRDLANNTDLVTYQAREGTDIVAAGSLSAGPHAPGATASLTLVYRNDGPMNSPGGTVQTIIPDGFVLGTLPAECAATPGQTLVSKGTSYTGTLVACSFATNLAAGVRRDFVLPLTMPMTDGSGVFPVQVVPPATIEDAVPSNNDTTVPYTVDPPEADIVLAKAKKRGGGGGNLSGAQNPGTVVRTELTLTNGNASTGDLAYTPANPLRVVDFIRPLEADGDAILAASPGWSCVVQAVPAALQAQAPSPTHTRMVVCQTTGSGTLTRNSSTTLFFETRIGAMADSDPAVTLSDRACAGGTALSMLGLSASAGPQPADMHPGNDCASAGNNLVATPVGAANNSGQLELSKEVSLDGVNWSKDVTLLEDADDLYWRIRITRPNGAGLLPIPTLRVSDDLPGIVGPDPGPATPAITVTTSTSGGVVAACPTTINAGSSAFNCTLTDVQPGASVDIVMHLTRPIGPLKTTEVPGSLNRLLTNTANASSPDAVLSGVLSDTARAQVAPRLDVAITNKTVTPATPAIGQPLVFTINAMNRGPFDITRPGDFVVTDDIYTGPATLAQPSYVLASDAATVTAGSSDALACSLAPSPAAPGYTRVTCQNVDPIKANTSHSVNIHAYIRKPELDPADYPAGSTVYTSAVNAAELSLHDDLCEWRSDAGANQSTSCRDPNARSNNRYERTFQVAAPRIELQQRKTKLVAAGRRDFRAGEELRFRFDLRNGGDSRAEQVEMTDILDPIPAGFSVELVGTSGENINAAPADPGYTLAARSVSCSQAAPNTNVVCHLAANKADSWLGPKEQVNFELRFRVTGDASTPVLYGDRAYVCADETHAYELAGACSPDEALAANNMAKVNGVIYPVADLAVAKTTLTAGPVQVGEPIQYALTVSNAGISTIERIRVVDVLPTGFQWLADGSHVPVATTTGGVSLDGPVTVSATVPAAGTGNVCYLSAGPANLTAASQHQEITCDLHGSFPPSAGASLRLDLWARAVPGVYDGSASAPLAPAARVNTARVQPGLDDTGEPVADDPVPGNDQSTSTIQVEQGASLSGRVFFDRGDDGDQDGTGAGQDPGLAGVVVSLTGTDAFGRAVSFTTTTDANGDYRFANLPASDASGYTITQAQPAGYDNARPQPNTPRPNRNAASTGVSPAGGQYATGNTDTSSMIGGIVVQAGAEGVQFDFPETRLFSLSGHVFADRSRDDVYLPGSDDSPIAGAELELLAWDPAASAYLPVPGAIVTTQADGSYQFTGLSPALTYAVRQVLPAGYLNLASAVKPGQIGGAACVACTVVSGASGDAASTDRIEGIRLTDNATGFDFGETVPVKVSGTVFYDTDNEGSQNTPADVGIEGVTITLSGTDDLGNPVSLSTTTAADGSFVFEDLRPGTYTLVEPNQPAGTANGITTAGQVGGVASGSASPVSSVPSTIAGIDLTRPGSESTGNLFGEIPLNSSIVGKVWMDADDDGVVDSSEMGIAGVTVRLEGTDIAGNPVSRTTTTDAKGAYAFTNLAPGTYKVVEPVQPAGTRNGRTVAGSLGGTATPVSTVPSAIEGIVLGANQHSIDNNFGEIPQNSSISGLVWLDLDNDGVADPGEQGLAGVPVRLEGTDAAGNPVSRQVVTDADGRYRFDDLPPGRYTVIEPEQPAGTFNGRTVAGSTGGSATPPTTPVSAITGIELGVNQHSTGNNFGELRGASISGWVYNDNNDDGRRDPGETGIPGVEVVLTGTDDTGASVRLSTTTDSEGRYSFQDLRPGHYVVTEPVQPPQTVNGQTTAGSAGGVPTPKSEPVSAIAGIELGAGVAAEDYNFGEIGDSPDLRVSKTVSPDVLVTGNAARYTILVRNAGQRASSGEYEVQDRLPAGLVLTATPAGEGWTCTGASGDTRFSCRASTVLAAGQVSPAPITVPVMVGEGVEPGELNNAVLVVGGGEFEFRQPAQDEREAFEEQPGNLPVCDAAISHNACRLPSQVVLAWPDLVVSKSADSEVFTVGAPAGYRIRVRNSGERASVGEYLVEDRLPAGVVLAGAPSGEGWRCTGIAGDTAFQCASGRELAAGQEHPGVIQVPVEVREQAVGEVHNVVIVSGGGEPESRQPGTDERSGFDADASLLEECLAEPAQNACRVPTRVQLPEVQTALVVAKRGDRQVAEVGDSVRYTIDIRHVAGAGLRQVDIVDRLPRGFTYIPGSARVGAVQIADPAGAPGPVLVFDIGELPAQAQRELSYRVRVGVGAEQGDGVNRARAHGCQREDLCVDPSSLATVPGSVASNQAEYRVTVRGGVFFSEGCVLGKVFVDCNNNHVQDAEELGIPGVRMYFEDGTWMVSDSEGKYSYCGLPPRSHTLKVDPSTLPVGSRLTTSSNRNLGDADSLFIDLKNGELHRADFIEGSCSNPVLEQVKARRTQGEVRAPETEAGRPALRFDSKPRRSPQQATDSANQKPAIVEPRPVNQDSKAATGGTEAQ